MLRHHMYMAYIISFDMVFSGGQQQPINLVGVCQRFSLNLCLFPHINSKFPYITQHVIINLDKSSENLCKSINLIGDFFVADPSDVLGF